jgi:hypothetical protein
MVIISNLSFHFVASRRNFEGTPLFEQKFQIEIQTGRSAVL